MIHAFITITVERSQRITRHDKVGILSIVELVVFHIEVRGEFVYLVFILRNVERESKTPIFGLYNIVEVDTELPTAVGHFTGVEPSDIAKTGRSREFHFFLQHIIGYVLIKIDGEKDTVIEDTEVDTGIPFVDNLPIDVVQLNGRRINRRHIEITR